MLRTTNIFSIVVRVLKRPVKYRSETSGATYECCVIIGKNEEPHGFSEELPFLCSFQNCRSPSITEIWNLNKIWFVMVMEITL